MSTQRFCHNCGKPVIVGAKFCAECGTSLASLSSTPPAPPKKPTETFTPFAVAREDDDDERIDRIDHLDIRQTELQVEIERDRPLKETIGAAVMFGQQLGMKPEKVEGRAGQTVDPKTFETQFAQEAGAIRPSTTRHVLKNEK